MPLFLEFCHFGIRVGPGIEQSRLVMTIIRLEIIKWGDHLGVDVVNVGDRDVTRATRM